MPKCFQEAFRKKVAIILDCFEKCIEHPSNLQARTYTWSSYKLHNTAKVLLGITPQGVISYISLTWGERVCDKFLTEHCGILGQTYSTRHSACESVGSMQASLSIPAFTKVKLSSQKLLENI